MNTKQCISCKEKDIEPKIFSKVEDATFLRCQTCGFVWLEKGKWPINQQEYYSEQYYSKDYVGRRNLKDLFSYRFRLLKKYFKPQGKLLEIGAASGDFLHLMQDVGYEVYGVELSTRAAKQSQLNYGIKLSIGTLHEAAFSDNMFDYVVMYHVLEHVPDPLATLKEVWRIMKPGARVLIEVPNIQSVDAFSRPLLLNMLDYPNHLYAFQPSTLTRLTRDANFKQIALSRSFPFLIAQYLEKLRTHLVRPALITNLIPNQMNTVSGKDLFMRASQESILKSMFSRVLPGMKMALIAEK